MSVNPPTSYDILLKRANDSRGRDWPAAADAAAELRARCPERPVGYEIGAAAARALRRFDEAAAILSEALNRFADPPWLITEQTWTAHARGDTDEARRWAAELRRRFPEQPAGYHIGSASARALRRFDEAEEILAAASTRLADAPWLLSEQAWIAYARGDTDEARRVAAELRRRYPGERSGYQIGGQMARALQQFDEAKAIALAASAQFPTEGWPISLQALNASAHGDCDEAIRLTADLRARYPDEPSGYSLSVSLFRNQNRLSEAQAALKDAESRFSSAPWFTRSSAEIANLAANRAKVERLLAALGGASRDLARVARSAEGEFGQVVVVLGMHRAGTSLSAKIVNRLGFALGGPLLSPGVDNPDGFNEHREINELHEALLAGLGATWDTSWTARSDPEASLRSAEAISLKQRLKAIVVEELRKSGGRWAFKDPRTACLLPLWIDLFDTLGITPVWLLAVRDPRAVAASLYKRNRLPLALGELLWLEHYLNALRRLGPEIAAVVHYENWFVDSRRQLGAVARAIGVDKPEAIDDAERSIIGELRHNIPAGEDIRLDIVGDVYSWLSSQSAGNRWLQRKAQAVWRDLEALAGGERRA